MALPVDVAHDRGRCKGGPCLGDAPHPLLQPNQSHVDFRDETTHYVVVPSKVLRIDRRQTEQYEALMSLAATIDLPRHQLEISPGTASWER